jgi:hypothetical protein
MRTKYSYCQRILTSPVVAVLFASSLLTLCTQWTPAVAQGTKVPLKTGRSQFAMREFNDFISNELSRPKSAGSLKSFGFETDVVRGRVIDHEGMPIVGALMAAVEDIGYSGKCYDENFDITDAEGRFFLVADAERTRVVVKRGETALWSVQRGGRNEILIQWPAPASLKLTVAPALVQRQRQLVLSSTHYWAGMSVLRRVVDLDVNFQAEVKDLLPGNYYVTYRAIQPDANLVTLGTLSLEPEKETKWTRGGPEDGGRKIRGQLPRGTEWVKVSQLKMTYKHMPQGTELVSCRADGRFETRHLDAGVYRLESPTGVTTSVELTEENKPTVVDMSPPTGTELFVKQALAMQRTGRWSIDAARTKQLLGHQDRDGVVEELLRIVRSRTSSYKDRNIAQDALGQLTDREDVLQTLLAMLASETSPRRQAKLIRAFEKSKSNTATIIKALAKHRHSDSFRVRWGCYSVLNQLADAEPGNRDLVIPLLVDMLGDSWPRTRGDVAAALGRMGAKDALPALMKAKKDPVGVVRVWAAWAIWKVNGDDKQAIALMTAQLYGDSLAGKWESAYLLAQFKDLPPLTVSALVEAAKYESKPPYVGVKYELNRIKRSAQATLKAQE